MSTAERRRCSVRRSGASGRAHGSRRRPGRSARAAAGGRRARSATATSRSSTSRAIRPASSAMISRKLSRAFGSWRGRAAQGLDEALDRGQRRPDLVAGIGDEVRAHPLDHHLLGLLAQRDQGAAATIAEVDRLDPRAELLGAIVAGAERDAAGRGAGERPADRGEHAGVAQHTDERHWRCRRVEGCAGRRRWPGTISIPGRPP